MQKRKRFQGWIALCVMFLCMASTTFGQEKILADYFDIPVNSPEGTEVIGRVHLERNKDVLSRPIPEGYHFEILKGEGLFTLETQYDLSKRLMGVFKVAKGKNTGETPSIHRLTIALKDGNRVLQKTNIKIHVAKETLLKKLYTRYAPQVIKNSRSYGRMKPSDEEVATLIDQLKNNGWKFPGLEKCYERRPQDYPKKAKKTIEYDWEKVVNRIGGLGYAYATSEVYGPEGNREKREELRNALYHTLLTYTLAVPIEGNDILIDGKPIGKCTGDGISLLQAHRLMGHQIATHQWVLTDPLIVPVLHLMPDILEGVRQKDETCVKLHHALIRYFQLFTAEPKNRRVIDNPNGRWGELQDTLYSKGAWADANLGHRLRTLLAMPIIWADYNRPMTYVQYWYPDFYQGKPFNGFSFSTGWTPHGIVSDVSHWMRKFNIPAQRYKQSGFQPDGTISHHTDNGTDAAMVAYGFGWLTDCNIGYQYFKGTPYESPGKYFQFQLDHLMNIYPHLFYKQQMDFLVAGRAFDSDMKKFVLRTYTGAAKELLKAQSKRSGLKGVQELKHTLAQLKENTYQYTGTDAYWVQEYLVHRNESSDKPYYASLKLKSERTVGAEDFNGKVRRSWHLGYGIMPVKVDGNEYAAGIIRNFDWHALPGLTEEWRTDPMPLGSSQASLPGNNKISGVLSDGTVGMGIYHHLPRETYSSATAFKSYHFISDKMISVGTDVARLRPGQGKDIATFLDQSALKKPLTICINGKTQTVNPGESVQLAKAIDGICWLHQGKKGYVIVPDKKLQLLVRTGNEINITDRNKRTKAEGFIIGINHGAEPGTEWDNAYRYIVIPNVSAKEMPGRVKALLNDLQFAVQKNTVHAVHSEEDKVWQYAFFKPANMSVGDITVTSNDVAEIMLRDNGKEWILAVNNPMPDGKKQTLSFCVSVPLATGTYSYKAGGIYPREGETVTVASEGKGSKITVELPDIRDAKHYNYQSDLYAAVPIVIRIPKK